MARPKKLIKRQKKVSVYFTKAEHLYLEKKAKACGISKGEYAREVSLGNKLSPTLTPEEADIFRKLTGMANNLNQIAKAAHLGEPLTRRVLETRDELNLVIKKLK